MIVNLRQWKTAEERESSSYYVECPSCEEITSQEELDVRLYRYHCPSCGSCIPQARTYGGLP